MSVFYILETNGFYQLRFSETHFCVSAGSEIDIRLKVAERYLKKYKTKEAIKKMLDNLDGGGKVPSTTVILCEERLKNGEALFVKELKEIEERCAEFNANNTPLKRTQRILTKMVRQEPKPLENRVVENSIIPKVTKPKLLNRTLIIGR